jgi:hypothetical protein
MSDTVDTSNDEADHSHVPPVFGRVSVKPDEIGTPIGNKATILAETDAALGFAHPPAVEFILVRPLTQFRVPFTRIGLSMNTFGHAAVRYQLDGRDILMNIEGLRDNIVQFRSPTEYFFGTDANLTGDQLGVYNRSMVCVRLYDVDEAKIRKLHDFYCELQRRCDSGRAKFWIVPMPLRELWLRIRPDSLIQYGNCARWTSEGLKRAGIVQKLTHWPKSTFISMFENNADAKVVAFKRVEHAWHATEISAEPLEIVSPLQTLRSIAYFNSESFANITVEVPQNGTDARIVRNENPTRPSKWRNLLNSKALVLASSLLTGAFLGRQLGLFAAVRYLMRSRTVTREAMAEARAVAATHRHERKVARSIAKDQRREKRAMRLKAMRELGQRKNK